MATTPSVTVRRRRPSSSRRALGSFTRVLEGALVSEPVSSSGVLSRLDARAKLVGAAVMLVSVSFVHSAAAIALCWLACLTGGILFGASARRMAGFLMVPVVFSIAVALPAVLNIITPGAAVLTICGLPQKLGTFTLPDALAVTDSGLLVAGRLVLRVGACVSIVAVVVLTTRRHRILQSLGALGVPRVFVAVLTMMERYLEVIVRAAEQIHLARISRTIRPLGLREEHSWVAAGMGALYRRSRFMSESVYLAMVARGFTGNYRNAAREPVQARDWAFLAAVASFGAALIAMDQLL